jgi:CRP-like cAMP-binding protein
MAALCFLPRRMSSSRRSRTRASPCCRNGRSPVFSSCPGWRMLFSGKWRKHFGASRTRFRTSEVSAIRSASAASSSNSRVYGRVTGDGVKLDLPLTHALLGEMVGSERETVTRAIDQLEGAGFLSRQGSHYRLHVAPDALAR